MARRRPNGTGTVTKRKDGRYYGRAYALTPTGERVRVSVYGKTWDEANDKLNEVMRETRAGNPVKREVVKLGDYLDYWCVQVAPSQVRPSTLASYETFIRLHIKPRLGSKRLDRLTPTDIRGFLRVMSTEPGRHGKPLSPRSVQYLHAILRNVLQHAMREELLVRNVARLVQVPTGQPREVQPLTQQEVSALLTAARGRRLYAAYVLMLAVGLRKGEALGLRWSDVDLDARTLRVRSTLQRLNGELHISAPKTSRSRRTLVLPRACRGSAVAAAPAA